MRNAPLRILCADPHPLVADWLRRAMDDAVVEHLADTESLVDRAEEVEPDVVVTEACANGADPLTLTGDLTRSHPGIGVLVLSAAVRAPLVWSAIEAGVTAYFGKADPPQRIVRGVSAAASGSVAFGDSVLELCPELRRFEGQPRRAVRAPEIRRACPADALTLREQEVLRLLAQGLQRADIASRLHRSPKTVDKHRAAVMRKLDIHDRAKLVLFAVREGLVTV